jgi:hypothetical protein
VKEARLGVKLVKVFQRSGVQRVVTAAGKDLAETQEAGNSRRKKSCLRERDTEV